jgi:hypothetical protein
VLLLPENKPWSYQAPLQLPRWCLTSAATLPLALLWGSQCMRATVHACDSVYAVYMLSAYSVGFTLANRDKAKTAWIGCRTLSYQCFVHLRCLPSVLGLLDAGEQHVCNVLP